MEAQTFQAIKIDVPPHPVYMRPNSSDLENYMQVFVQREYACVEALGSNIKFIVDAGAYVGYSAVWFESKFPTAKVLALEPDPQNFRMLELNTDFYSYKFSLRKAALWNCVTKIGKHQTPYRDGKEWTYQYSDIPSGNIQTECVNSLILKHSPHGRIDLLKIDIEGGEVPIFLDSASWIDLVDNIAIELHDDTIFGNATQTFVNACADKFTIEKFGEITFAQRRR